MCDLQRDWNLLLIFHEGYQHLLAVITICGNSLVRKIIEEFFIYSIMCQLLPAMVDLLVIFWRESIWMSNNRSLFVNFQASFGSDK